MLMPTVVDRIEQVARMFTAPRAITLVSVPWFPWPRRSRQVLEALERGCDTWFGNSIAFFDLWPEQEEELHRWYDELCARSHPRFELHGHGYGPFWWIVHGEIADCLTKPYEQSVEALQQRYIQLNLASPEPPVANPDAPTGRN
jgi:hypothetical protein